MPIRGLTDRGAAFPRIGTLRKGGPKRTVEKNGKVIEVVGTDLNDHFRFDCDDDEACRIFASIYGNRPNHITVMLPFPTTDENFEAWQEHHTAGALQHRCDGKVCMLRLDADAGRYLTDPVPCPSIALLKANPKIDKRQLCHPAGRLKVIIPELSRLGYVLVTTTSIHDIIELQGNLEAAETMRGDLRGIPFVLSRREREVSTPEIGADKQPTGRRVRRTKGLLSIEPDRNWVVRQFEYLQRAALPAPARALPPPNVDPDTGELFDGEEIEEAPAVVTTSYPQTTIEAELRFFNRYGKTIGGDDWAAVQRYLRNRMPKPSTIDGWIMAAQEVRDQAQRPASAEPMHAGGLTEADYAAIDAASAARA